VVLKPNVPKVTLRSFNKFLDISLTNEFFDMTAKAWAMEAEINN
jgi:hypothetical protein